MKKILIVIVLIAAAALVAPKFIGDQAESNFRHNVDKLAANPAITLSIAEYHKGWFGSDAKLKLAIQPQGTPVMPAVDINLKIFHGPFLWQADSFGFGIADAFLTVDIPEDAKAELSKLEGFNPDSVKLALRMASAHSGNAYFKLTPFTLAEADKQIAFDAADIKLQVAGDKAKMQGYWNGMTASENGNPLATVGKITLDSEQTLVKGQWFEPTALAEGEFSMQLSAFEIHPPVPEQSVNLHDVSVKVSADFENDLFKLNALLGAKDISAMQLNFKDFVYDFTLENLDAPTMQEYQEYANSEEVQQNPMLIGVKLQELLPKLIAKNPTVKINKLGVITDSGEIHSDLVLNFDQQLFDANNPMTMMIAMNANAKGHAPQAFFANLGYGAEVQQMVQQNFLVQENDMLKFDFSFKQGQALLNGKPIPLM